MYDKTNKNQRLWVTTDPFFVYDSEEKMLSDYNEIAFDNDWDEETEVNDKVMNYINELVISFWDEKFDTGYARNIDDIVVTGYFGGWRGPREIVPEKCKNLEEAIWKCCSIRGDWEAVLYFETDEKGVEHLYIDVHHHDGSCKYELSKLLNPNEEDEEKFKTKPISSKMVLDI